MKIWPFFRSAKRNIENPGHAITWASIFGSQYGSDSVDPATALKVSAALACVRVLAESVASLSWIVYRRNSEGGKDRASEHYAYSLLHHRPNDIMTAFSFRERIIKDILLHGNGYALIERDNGMPVALWPLNPSMVRPQLDQSERNIKYAIKSSAGETRIYNHGDILHVPCLGDGIIGKSVISYNAGAFELSLSEDEYARSFFSNGAYAGGVLEAEKSLSKEARDRLRDGWSNAYGKNQSGSGWHKVAVLEDGLKWKPMTVNPKDAMALESRKYQLSDIARMFRVPPHLIGDLEKATFSNIEHQSLEFVVHSLRPWVIRLEQEFNYKLFDGSDRKTHFSELLMDSMLRGDIKARNEAYSIMRQNGIINADEWRSLENMNPLPLGQGKKYIVQLNMQELSSVGQGGKNA